jgi:DNA-binding CsgD family transcriptional regulator
MKSPAVNAQTKKILSEVAGRLTPHLPSFQRAWMKEYSAIDKEEATLAKQIGEMTLTHFFDQLGKGEVDRCYQSLAMAAEKFSNLNIPLKHVLLMIQVYRNTASLALLETSVNGKAYVRFFQAVDQFCQGCVGRVVHVYNSVLSRTSLLGRGLAPKGYLQNLTRRENEILQLIVDGRRNREISALLNISVKTVETHRANIMRKLSVHNTVQLIRYALRQGVIPIES